jgi:aminoglycoside phosphotransferase (APT) family kinase protein
MTRPQPAAQQLRDDLPQGLRAALALHLPWAAEAPARRMQQGRSNRVYRLDSPRGPLAFKLYDPASATPLFPNRPEDERRVLTALAGTALAPDPLAAGRTGGRRWLVYRWVEPGGAAPDPAEVGEGLRRLHWQALPGWLPAMTRAGAEAQAAAMLRALPVGEATRLAALRPLPGPREAAAVLLHGDPVPGNILRRAAGGLCLIDWQCPAAGDPAYDIALYLSPAMQRVHGGRALSRDEVARFWAGYGAGAQRRYMAQAPFLHWRMALYCAWRCAQGDAAYAPGLALELLALEQADGGGGDDGKQRAEDHQRG